MTQFLNKFQSIKTVGLLLALMFLFYEANCQKIVDSQTSIWTSYSGSHRISNKFALRTEWVARWSAHLNDFQQSNIRLGLEYNHSSGTQFTVGYAKTKMTAYGKQPVSYPFGEHQFWQQILLQHKVGFLNFSHRYRSEFRFLQHKVKSSSGEFDFDKYIQKKRVRYRMQITIPLNHHDLVEKTYFITMNDEVFLGYGANAGNNLLEQNRMYALFGYRLDKRFTLQGGYFNQYQSKSDNIHVENNHSIYLSINYNMDLRHKVKV